MLSCVFFRPEEYRLPSEGIDDAWVFQLLEIYEWDEHERLLPFQDATIQLSVDLHPYRSGAVTALRFDRHDQRLVP